MEYLLDTNLFLRLWDTSSVEHVLSGQVIGRFRSNGATLYYTPQNLIEFWAVATRPEAINGLGLTVTQANSAIQDIKTFYSLLPDTGAIAAEWERLVVQYSVTGKQVHDARLVAVMLAHGITHLLTFNTAHFTRFAEITVVDPVTV